MGATVGGGGGGGGGGKARGEGGGNGLRQETAKIAHTQAKIKLQCAHFKERKNKNLEKSANKKRRKTTKIIHLFFSGD